MHKIVYEGDSKVIKRLCEMVNEIIDRGSGAIADLTDVELTDLADNDILKYDATEEKWVNAEDAGGVEEFSQLTDVNLTDLADGQIPKYNATTQKWENADESGGTTVSITPTLSSGTKIADFEIDGTAGSLYAPNGGGGGTGGYEQTELFTSATPVNSGTLNLSDDISNYDVLCFEYALVGSYGSGDNSLSYKYVGAKYFIEAFPNTATRETDHLIIDGYDNFYLYAKMGNANNKIDVWNVGSPNTGVLKVFGIKCGSGSQGGGFEKTILYEGTDVIGSLQSHITLEDSWDNYDMLEVVAFYAGSSTYSDYVSPEALTKAQLMGNDRACALATYGNSSCACWHLNANHKDMDIFGTNSNNIWKIYGIKFGGGSGTSTDVIPIEAGDGANSRTFTFTKKPKNVQIYWTTGSGWSAGFNIIWGQNIVEYVCSTGSVPSANGSLGAASVVYDDVNNTMTLTGVNPFGAANNTNGQGLMFVDYGEGGGCGTDVEANPSEEPTDELNTIRIGDTVYEITGGGSGGGGFSEETLYEGTVSQATYTLSNPISNFDMIRVLGTYFDTYSGKQLYFTNLYSVNDLISAIGTTDSFGLANDSQYTYFIVSSETQFTRSIEQSIYICGVYGVKFGSNGAGGGADIVTEHYTGGDNTTSRTFTLPDDRTPIFVRLKGLMTIEGATYWQGELSFMWGDSIAFGTCSNYIPYNQQLGGNDAVTYSGNTFTIQGFNIGYTFNTSTSDFDVTYVYDLGGGTEVIANPEGEATDELTKIQIGDEIYEIVGGGSSGDAYTATVLFNDVVAVPSEITLSDDIDNYDQLLIGFGTGGEGYGDSKSYIIDVDDFITRYPYVAGASGYGISHFLTNTYNTSYARVICGSAKNKLYAYEGNEYWKYVIGIKYGTGGGQGGDAYTATEIFKVQSPDICITSGEVALSQVITDFDEIEFIYRFNRTNDSGRTSARYRVDDIIANYPYASGDIVTSPYMFLEMYDTNYLAVSLGNTNNQSFYISFSNGVGIERINGIKYGASGGSGTEVEANPSEEPTDTLTTIKIGDTVYDIEGAGGSGYEATLIYDGSTLSTLQSSIELDDRWDNYDAIYLTFKFGGDGSTFGGLLLKEQLLEALNHTYMAIGSYTQNYVGAHIVNDYKTFNQIYGGGNYQQNIYAVYGLKFGSGGGGSSLPFEIVIDPNDNGINLIYEYDDGQ